MIVFGGYDWGDISGDQFTGLKNDILSYDFDGNWLDLDHNKMEQPSPRMFHTATYDGTADTMTIIGGVVFARFQGDASTIYRSCGVNDVWTFNFTSRNWTNVIQSSPQCNSGLRLSGSSVLMCLLVMISFFLHF